jgi:hypothetical protein
MEGGRGGEGRCQGGRGMKSRLKETAEKMRSNSQSYKIRS